MSGRDNDPTDQDLVDAAKRGEVRAFETLLLRHEKRVFRVLRLFGVHASEREDVAQEVFLRVFRHLHGFRAGRRFDSWVYRVSANAAADWRKAQHRRSGREHAADLEEIRDSGVASDTHVAAEREQARRHLEACLEDLSARERDVFVLRELEGLETREVARVLGITRITVRRHLGRARERLRSTLEGRTTEKKNP